MNQCFLLGRQLEHVALSLIGPDKDSVGGQKVPGHPAFTYGSVDGAEHGEISWNTQHIW